MIKPIRILHVVGSMNRGGVETWLMHVLRNIDRTRFAFDFLVHDPFPAAFDEEILSLGGRLIACPRPSSLSYPARLRSALRLNGPYDVIHSHVHHFSGVVLAVAASVGIPVRIAHSHNALPPDDLRTRRRLYLSATERLIRRFATDGLAASVTAAEDLFGRNWRSDGRWAVQFCGIDFRQFRGHETRESVRRELGIPDDACVIGHVGRFVLQKNHRFILEICAQAFERDARARLVLVGDGPLRQDIEDRARSLGIEGRVRFLGVRSDIPRVLRAFDVFLFPSLHEGLGLVGVEAQAAGVPVLLSDTIPHEIEVVSELVAWQKLESSASDWASRALALASAPGPHPAAALAKVESSRFDIAQSVRALELAYGLARAA